MYVSNAIRNMPKVSMSPIACITFYKIDLFTFSFQPTLELFNVAVLEEYRGNQVAKFAKENNYKSIYLTCLDSAMPAQRFYESIGFKKMNSFKYSFNVDEILPN